MGRYCVMQIMETVVLSFIRKRGKATNGIMTKVIKQTFIRSFIRLSLGKLE